MTVSPENSDSPDNSENVSNKKPSHRRQTFSSLYSSAIEAEIKTGRKERQEHANRSLLVRIFTILTGLIITTLGLMMLLLPGPGLIVIALGLAILAIDVPFARRLLNIVRQKLPQDESGKLTKKTILTMIICALLGIIFTAVSIWWTFFRK